MFGVERVPPVVAITRFCRVCGCASDDVRFFNADGLCPTCLAARKRQRAAWALACRLARLRAAKGREGNVSGASTGVSTG